MSVMRKGSEFKTLSLFSTAAVFFAVIMMLLNGHVWNPHSLHNLNRPDLTHPKGLSELRLDYTP